MYRRGTLESLTSDPALLSDRHLRLLDQFKVGEPVESSYAARNFGTIKSIDYRNRKLEVIWNSGMVEQVDPDDIQVIPDAHPTSFKDIADIALDNIFDLSSGRRTASMSDLFSELKSRRAVYHKECGRVYQRSRIEADTETLKCPRCHSEGMDKESFSRGVYLFRCPSCSWKITTDKLV